MKKMILQHNGLQVEIMAGSIRSHSYNIYIPNVIAGIYRGGEITPKGKLTESQFNFIHSAIQAYEAENTTFGVTPVGKVRKEEPPLGW